MEVARYGITLQRLSKEHLEMVRIWRNSEHVRPNMDFQDMISTPQQLAWFESLSQDTNFFFIAQKEGHPFGVVHIKDIDWKHSIGEAGVFTGDQSFLNTFSPILSIFLMMDLAFFYLELRQLRAKIHEDNAAAIQFNRKLGYRPMNEQSGSFLYYQVDQNAYLKATHSLRNTAMKIFGRRTSFKFKDEESSLTNRYSEISTNSQEYFSLESI